MKKITLTIFLILFFAVAAYAKVNINTATVDELSSLPGIGQAKAEAITKYRQKNGKFTTVEDITNVKGIGDKMLKKIKPEITVGS